MGNKNVQYNYNYDNWPVVCSSSHLKTDPRPFGTAFKAGKGTRGVAPKAIAEVDLVASIPVRYVAKPDTGKLVRLPATQNKLLSDSWQTFP